MLSASLYSIVTRFGDLLGTTLYDSYGGFVACVAAITTAYALILPMLRLIPNELVATPDGRSAQPS